MNTMKQQSLYYFIKLNIRVLFPTKLGYTQQQFGYTYVVTVRHQQACSALNRSAGAGPCYSTRSATPVPRRRRCWGLSIVRLNPLP